MILYIQLSIVPGSKWLASQRFIAGGLRRVVSIVLLATELAAERLSLNRAIRSRRNASVTDTIFRC